MSPGVATPDSDASSAWSELDPQIAEYIRTVAAPATIPVSELTVDALRQRTRRQRSAEGGVPEMHSVETLSLSLDGKEVGGRLYGPNPDPQWVIVYFHGGGWVTGDLETADGAARRLAAKSGAHVISVDYRLAPEHPFPAAIEDAEVAVRWARGFAVDRPLVVAGDSAGGNLAAVCSQGELALLADVAAQLLCYPVVDSDLSRPTYTSVPDEFPLGGGIMAWYWDQYLPDHSARADPTASPLHSAELDTAAPAVVLLAGAGSALGRRPSLCRCSRRRRRRCQGA